MSYTTEKLSAIKRFLKGHKADEISSDIMKTWDKMLVRDYISDMDFMFELLAAKDREIEYFKQALKTVEEKGIGVMTMAKWGWEEDGGR